MLEGDPLLCMECRGDSAVVYRASDMVNHVYSTHDSAVLCVKAVYGCVVIWRKYGTVEVYFRGRKVGLSGVGCA